MSRTGENSSSAVIVFHINRREQAGSEINPLWIGGALSCDLDRKVLNPNGVETDLPFWVFKRLKKLHLLDRNHKTGLMKIDERKNNNQFNELAETGL